MMQIRAVAILVGLSGMGWLPAAGAKAQTAPPVHQAAQASQPMASEFSAQRRRPVRRVPIYPSYQWEPDVYPRYDPGPNAVRDCTATYVLEYRPSGTVITPRMHCHWRRVFRTGASTEKSA